MRILHIPTGIVVTAVLALAAPEPGAGDAGAARPALRARTRRRSTASGRRRGKGQVGSGDRSERIRTYNFPQGRVTDHRINLTLYKLDQVLSGDALDELIEALITEHQASLLAAEATAS